MCKTCFDLQFINSKSTVLEPHLCSIFSLFSDGANENLHVLLLQSLVSLDLRRLYQWGLQSSEDASSFPSCGDSEVNLDQMDWGD
jgi:hypothetical protein